MASCAEGVVRVRSSGMKLVMDVVGEKLVPFQPQRPPDQLSCAISR